MMRRGTVAAASRRHLIAAAIAVSSLAHARAGLAEHQPRPAAPIRLRLEGYASKAPTGVTPETHLVMQYQGKSYEFDLTKMVVVTGDRPSSQVLQDVAPYRVNFVLHGPLLSLGPLIGAETGQKLVLTARYRSGTRDLLIDSIVLAADTTPTPQ